MGDLAQIVRAPSWGLSVGAARFYGWRWWLHVGPWIVLLAAAPKPEDEG